MTKQSRSQEREMRMRERARRRKRKRRWKKEEAVQEVKGGDSAQGPGVISVSAVPLETNSLRLCSTFILAPFLWFLFHTVPFLSTLLSFIHHFCIFFVYE